MKVTLTRLSNTVSAMVSLMFGTAAKQSDHKRLISYIVALNEKNTPDAIIHEASLCLKDILDFRLFAFVYKSATGIDVWLNPRMYKKSLESVVISDFDLAGNTEINYLNHTFEDDEGEQVFSMNNLISYNLEETAYQSRIYMLPNQKMLGYHDDIVNVILKSTANALFRQMSIARLTDAAALDPLTGCYNRREFETQINRCVASATRHKSDLSVFMFDIDHFKKVNDTFGHQAGDQVLKHIVSLVKNNIRTGDILARYGGEEFIVVLPETGEQEARDLADRIRKKIAADMIVTDVGTISVTSSFGVARLTPNAATDKLIQDADTMLYRAKTGGRNRVMPQPLHVLQTDKNVTDLQKLVETVM
ncbi:MAG: GGDEF domain-containing protein [Pseudomonadota bacterium]